MRLAWGAKVSPLFIERLLAICERLGIDDPNWMMGCIAFETGRTFKPDIRNPTSGATGLIQFMPSTAASMGTSTDALAALTAEDQLVRVEQYFRPYAGRLKSLDDVYMAILWPRAIGKLLNAPLFSKDDADARAYFANRGLDVNDDGVVTKGEATAYVQKALNEGLQPGNFVESALEPHAGTTIPVEDKPTPVEDSKPAPTPDFSTYRPSEENPMLAALLPLVTQLFSAGGQAQLAPIISKPADQIAPFLLSLFSMIGQQTGVLQPGQKIANDEQAIAAVAELNKQKATNAQLVAQIEQHALSYLADLAPMFDKLAAADAAGNAARIAGANAASERAQKEKWDMTPWLVWIAGGTATVLVLALLGAIIYQATTGERSIDTALIGLAGPLLAIAMGVWREIFSYRFDGSPSSAASNAITQQIAVASRKV